MTSYRLLVAILAAALFSFGPLRAEPAATPLTPHRAAYELSLLKGSGAKAPAQARGRIAFDFSGSACDGYVQNFRQVTELQPEEGETRVSDMTSATFEGGDAHDYRFKTVTKVDERVSEEVDGAAKKTTDKTVAVETTKPKRARLRFSGPILFPTEHIAQIIATARAGNNMLSARVYDGSGDGSKLFDTLTVIGKPTTAATPEKAAQVEPLKTMRRWPATISYFEVDKKDDLPAYTLAFEVYENGVSRALRLDYGDFVLAGEMTELTLLPVPKCGK